jgi:hypothetical protein
LTKSEFIKKYNLTEGQFYGTEKIDGSLSLSSLTSIPEGFNPTVGGYLSLNSLKSIPEGFNPTVGGDLYLNSLTSIPEGFNPTVGGALNLSSLTSVPEGFNPTVGGSLYLNSLKSIPEGNNPTVVDYIKNNIELRDIMLNNNKNLFITQMNNSDFDTDEIKDAVSLQNHFMVNFKAGKAMIIWS